ncbi:intradiol ring-cleavage dioxygenase [Arthrospiribacter ruber]|uniref:Intradiol ring-cleavage dioxygenase n=1 Tax=Arthrospiribacter ruber TaxID=2487934 RepID=A0A951IZC8_9BACT|nr:intradiol ring-cleavage dioxygenase [Arthrospiribacter ruber]MBW3468323.1 intradiol ring-cleavage dioxygenase [Arthrospiribacter ruber]
MKKSMKLILLAIGIQIASGCFGQQKGEKSLDSRASTKVGGGCDGCEEMYYGMPEEMTAADTSLGWYDKGQKLLVTGTVFKLDGRTPAPGVILYYYQTDETGYYPKKEGLDKRVKNHGSIRGWIKTDEQGRYAIYTIRPAPYPDRSSPAHIHVLIKEPNIENEYFIDDFVFDDDPLVFAQKKKRPFENRGGSGILRPLLASDFQVAEHNIILGLNIPDYPKYLKAETESGLPVGETSPSFMPYHAWGPDKGTKTCPICKYGRYHGIIYFVGKHTDWEDIKNWLGFLEMQSIIRNQYLKAFFVYSSEKEKNPSEAKMELEKLGRELDIKNIALTFVPSFSDTTSEVNLYRINPHVENTFIIYRHRDIIEKFIDLTAGGDSFELISLTLDRTQSSYFDLKESWQD